MNKTMNAKRDEILALPSVVAVTAKAAEMSDERISVSEVKALIKDKGMVERVYITRGDSERNEDNILCDKFSGLLINDGIYWIEDSFATLEELSEILHPLGIGITSRGSYGTWGWGDDRQNQFDATLTKVGEPQATMLDEGSRWLEKAVWAKEKEGRLKWTIKEMQKVLLDTEKKSAKNNVPADA